MHQESRPIILICALALVVAATLGLLIFQPATMKNPDSYGTATALLETPAGENVGKITFQQAENGVLVKAEAHGLPLGGHAMTIHTVGSCTSNPAATGGHFTTSTPGRVLVDSEGETPGNAGELPNLYAGYSGTARADFFTDAITIVDDKQHSIFDDD